MRQLWPRIGFVLMAAAGALITVMDPDLPLIESIKLLTGANWVGLLIVVIPAFSSPTQVGEAAKAIGVVE